MPITITWNDGINPLTTYTVPDDVISSLDQYRQRIMPVQTSVQAMVVAIFMQNIVNPALNLYPTPAIQTAQQTVQTAQAALQTALTGVVQINIALVISTASLPSATVGTAYSQALTASGGAGSTFTWTVTAGTLPAGLSLNSSGLLSGTPTMPGTTTVTIQVTDSANNTATQDLTITVVAGS
jgi:hypothetical protein